MCVISNDCADGLQRGQITYCLYTRLDYKERVAIRHTYLFNMNNYDESPLSYTEMTCLTQVMNDRLHDFLSAVSYFQFLDRLCIMYTTCPPGHNRDLSRHNRKSIVTDTSRHLFDALMFINWLQIPSNTLSADIITVKSRKLEIKHYANPSGQRDQKAPIRGTICGWIGKVKVCYMLMRFPLKRIMQNFA